MSQTGSELISEDAVRGSDFKNSASCLCRRKTFSSGQVCGLGIVRKEADADGDKVKGHGGIMIYDL